MSNEDNPDTTVYCEDGGCPGHDPTENARCDGVRYDMMPHEVRALIEKAVREEREATVRYLRRVESDDRWIDGSAVIPRIERGMHRK